MMNRTSLLCCFVASLATVDGFGIARAPFFPTTTTTLQTLRQPQLTQLHMGWADAFKNDSSLGKAPNAGLTNGPSYNENVTVNGKKVPGAVVNQKLTAVAGKVRVRIPVNCQKGDCGTCMVNLNGRKVKACQTPLPAGKAVIQTL